MANRSVNIEIDPIWVKRFSQNGSKLCMAKVVRDGNGSEVCDVIAKAEGIMQDVSVNWTEDYQISVTRSNFMDGAQVMASERPTDIRPGQTYTYDGRGGGGNVSNDSNIPSDAIGFANRESASALLSMKIDGRFAPIFVSRDEMAPGKDTLTPTSKVVFWFSNRGEAGSMVDGPQGAAHYLDLSGGESANLKFDQSGQWS